MSSGSESDEDYVPGEPEQLSEEESADEETEKQYELENEQNNKKRKVSSVSKGKKKMKVSQEVVVDKEAEHEDNKVVDQEDEKKKEEDLWAKFLEGTDTIPKKKDTAGSNQQAKSLSNLSKPEANVKEKIGNDTKDREKRIFEFAGETIVVENNVIKERIKSDDSIPAGIKLDGPSQTVTRKASRKTVGISDILGQINKKNKLSTLEKSKLDWSTYKQQEGIEEEIRSHNKGKHGYLERRDFLERADMRQYEIERDMRMSRRSNR